MRRIIAFVARLAMHPLAIIWWLIGLIFSPFMLVSTFAPLAIVIGLFVPGFLDLTRPLRRWILCAITIWIPTQRAISYSGGEVLWRVGNYRIFGRSAYNGTRYSLPDSAQAVLEILIWIVLVTVVCQPVLLLLAWMSRRSTSPFVRRTFRAIPFQWLGAGILANAPAEVEQHGPPPTAPTTRQRRSRKARETKAINKNRLRDIGIIETLHAQNAILTRRVTALNTDNGGYQQQVTQLVSDRTQMQTEMNQATAEGQQHRARIEEISSEIVRLSTENSRLEAEVHQLTLRSELVDIREQELRQVRTDNDSFRDSVALAHQQHETEERDTIRALAEANTDLASKMEQAWGAHESTQELNKELEIANGNLQKSVEHLTSQDTQAKQQISDLQGRIARLENRNGSLERTIEIMKSENENMVNLERQKTALAEEQHREVEGKLGRLTGIDAGTQTNAGDYEHINWLYDQLNTLQDQTVALQTVNSDLEEEVQRWKERTGEAIDKDANRQDTQQDAAAQDPNDESEATGDDAIVQHSSEIKRLKIQIKQMEGDAQGANGERDRLQKQLWTVEEDLNDAMYHLAQEKAKHGFEDDKTIKSLQEQLQAEKDKRDDLQKTLYASERQLLRQITDLKEDKDGLQQKLDAQQTAANAGSQQQANLLKQIHDLKVQHATERQRLTQHVSTLEGDLAAGTARYEQLVGASKAMKAALFQANEAKKLAEQAARLIATQHEVQESLSQAEGRASGQDQTRAPSESPSTGSGLQPGNASLTPLSAKATEFRPRQSPLSAKATEFSPSQPAPGTPTERRRRHSNARVEHLRNETTNVSPTPMPVETVQPRARVVLPPAPATGQQVAASSTPSTSQQGTGLSASVYASKPTAQQVAVSSALSNSQQGAGLAASVYASNPAAPQLAGSSSPSTSQQGVSWADSVYASEPKSRPPQLATAASTHASKAASQQGMASSVHAPRTSSQQAAASTAPSTSQQGLGSSVHAPKGPSEAATGAAAQTAKPTSQTASLAPSASQQGLASSSHGPKKATQQGAASSSQAPKSTPRPGLASSSHAPKATPQQGLASSSHAPQATQQGTAPSAQAPKSASRPGLASSSHAPTSTSKPATVAAVPSTSQQSVAASSQAPRKSSQQATSASAQAPKSVFQQIMATSIHAPKGTSQQGSASSSQAPKPTATSQSGLAASSHAPKAKSQQAAASSTQAQKSISKPATASDTLSASQQGLASSSHAPKTTASTATTATSQQGLAASSHAPEPKPQSGLAASSHAPKKKTTPHQ